jgi:FkbM family methyltransferase
MESEEFMKNNVGTLGRMLLIKKVLASILCYPLVGLLVGLILRNKIPHKGSRIEVPLNGDPRVSAMLFWGIYESSEIRFVRRYLGDDLDVIELGSSLGVVSCEITKKLAGKKKLVCVEANEQIFQILRKNVLYNAPVQEVSFIHGAIDYSGKEVIDFVIGDSNLSSHTDSGAMTTLKKINVPAVTLSALLESEGIDEYALVCDIEGAEAALFAQDRQAFVHCKRMIIELHDTFYNNYAYEVQDLIELIQKETEMLLRDRYGSVCVFENRY